MPTPAFKFARCWPPWGGRHQCHRLGDRQQAQPERGAHVLSPGLAKAPAQGGEEDGPPLPVVSVALIRDPAYGGKAAGGGGADFVASARSHLADPDWGNKARQGREEEIPPLHLLYGLLWQVRAGRAHHLRGEPGEGYEAQRCPPLPRDGEGRLVVVLGVAPPD